MLDTNKWVKRNHYLYLFKDFRVLIYAVVFSGPCAFVPENPRLSVIIFVAQVISKLTEAKASHIPYRDSKLTRVLQSSLSGHGRVSVRLSCVDICLRILIC